MRIKSICFNNFRGYTEFVLDDLGRLVVLVGPNAVGKTNIVEGIQLLTAGESFRRPRWEEVVTWGSDAAAIRAEMVEDKRDVVHKMAIQGGKRSYEVNGKKKSAAQIRGTCPCVMFIPDHLQMVKSSSSARRDAIDSVALQLSKGFSQVRSDYVQALKQRNLLVKNEVHSGALFDSWNESLCVNGARLYMNRRRLFDRLKKHMASIYSQLVEGEELAGVYIPSWARFDECGKQCGDVHFIEGAPNVPGEASLEEVQKELEEASVRLADQELSRKTSLVGPHKDEMAFFINGKNARLFASQGQQRTIVLAWKLAEVELVREVSGADPVLLLDDVMSELDESRRDALTEFIEGTTQAFVTTTNLGYFSQELLDQAQVIGLPLAGTRSLEEI